jgi:hypothetical protein
MESFEIFILSIFYTFTIPCFEIHILVNEKVTQDGAPQSVSDVAICKQEIHMAVLIKEQW